MEEYCVCGHSRTNHFEYDGSSECWEDITDDVECPCGKFRKSGDKDETRVE